MLLLLGCLNSKSIHLFPLIDQWQLSTSCLLLQQQKTIANQKKQNPDIGSFALFNNLFLVLLLYLLSFIYVGTSKLWCACKHHCAVRTETLSIVFNHLTESSLTNEIMRRNRRPIFWETVWVNAGCRGGLGLERTTTWKWCWDEMSLLGGKSDLSVLVGHKMMMKQEKIMNDNTKVYTDL